MGSGHCHCGTDAGKLPLAGQSTSGKESFAKVTFNPGANTVTNVEESVGQHTQSSTEACRDATLPPPYVCRVASLTPALAYPLLLLMLLLQLCQPASEHVVALLLLLVHFLLVARVVGEL